MVRCLVPRLPALAVCLTLVQLLRPCSADFAVVGPPEPILAMVGGDAELPCHLSPKRSAESMELMWVGPSHRQVVLTYAHGQEDTPAEEYRGRTSVLREDVTAGTAALRIRNVTASDNGTYVCYFQDGDFYAKAQVVLQVAALGSDPHIEMKGYEAGGIRVNCWSAGWYPQPQVEWRDARGQRISNEVVTEATDPQGLCAASASVILEEGSQEGVSCVIRNPLLGQERSAGLSIPGPFFRNAEPRMAFITPILTGMVVLLGVSCLVCLVCLVWRRPQVIRALSQEKRREQELQRVESAQEKLQDDLSKCPSPSLGILGSLVTRSLTLYIVPCRVDKQRILTTLVPRTRISASVLATNRSYFEFGQEVPKSHWRRGWTGGEVGGTGGEQHCHL
ncbi:butyrophilin subfamily 3 member A2-like [Artibeus jamaicensis]|uniref:butyrophilin subfamily 3 member A2-like n=1 Tax=Artibeus jamaicensis TaxID=9417 RepID=UPI00235ABC43|nr:butyrophilin subfamily 3 member A2-like [Artibeus jamaicensis]